MDSYSGVRMSAGGVSKNTLERFVLSPVAKTSSGRGPAARTVYEKGQKKVTHRLGSTVVVHFSPVHRRRRTSRCRARAFHVLPRPVEHSVRSSVVEHVHQPNDVPIGKNDLETMKTA